MSFHVEAYPQDFPQFAVPVIEGSNVSPEEHSRALTLAAEEANKRFREEYPFEKIGGPIVFACHNPIAHEGFEQQACPARNNSIVY